MKGLKVMLGVLLFSGFFNSAKAQCEIVSEHIYVTFEKTTHLIFPYAIQSVDHGSNGIMVQQRRGAVNILHVKAAKENFAPTSLSVVTSDGAYYSFIVEYAPDVYDINYFIANNRLTPLQQVLNAPSFLHKSRTHDQIGISLNGIYADGVTTWFKWNLHNQSLNNFEVNYSKYFLRDKKRLKRRAVNERELLPNYYSGTPLIQAKDHQLLVVGFDGLHVKRHEQMIIQLGDDSGRAVEMKIPSRLFRKAKRLP